VGDRQKSAKDQSMRHDGIPDALRIRQSPRDPAFYANPYPFYQTLHTAGGMVFWEDYGFWCFADHARVSALLRDRRFGRQILHVMTREALGWPEPKAHCAAFDALERHSLLSLEPPDHTRLRLLVNRAFVSRAIDRMKPAMMELCHGLIDAFGEGPVDLIAAYATPIPVMMIADLIGIGRDHAPDLLAWSHAMVAMYQFGRDEAIEHKAAEASLAFDAFLRTMIALRRKAPTDDLISHLIAAEEQGGRLSEDEMVSTLVLLLNAGHEATVHTIGNGVHAVLAHGLDTQAFAGPDAALAIEEVLRFDPPLHLFTRHALTDVTIDGIEIRQGEEIGLMLGAANHDPAVFSEPHVMRLDRQAAMHTSFGGGIHFCIGAPLARLELDVALNVLFTRKPALKLIEPAQFRDVFHFRGIERLMIDG
jgi:cytochrome P450